MESFDVAIIGAGPAGLFAADYILKNSSKLKVVMFEKGNNIDKRNCCGNCSACQHIDCCNILCGVGGSGFFSDGKLILDLHSGGLLDSISNLSEKQRDSLSKYIVKTLRDFDGVSEDGPDKNHCDQTVWKSMFNKYGLEIKHYDVLHMGTSNLKHITTNFINELMENTRFFLKSNCNIIDVNINSTGQSVLTSENESFVSSTVIFSSGKTSSDWMKKIFMKRKIKFYKTPTYVGVRFETSQKSVEKLFDYSFDPKIWCYNDGHKIKTHCFCRNGNIICSNYNGLVVAGGHTMYTKDNHVPVNYLSPKSNFNILVSCDKPKEDIIKTLSKFNNTKLTCESLFDFMYPTQAILSDVLDSCHSYSIRNILDELDNIGSLIVDFIERLSNIVPGIKDENNTIYAPSVEWLMESVEVDHHMETSTHNWFAVGDGAGLSQGIVHAAATGIIAAHEICLREDT